MCVLREIRHVEARCNRTAQQRCIVGDGSVIQGWQQRGSWNERETKRNETRNETKRETKYETKRNVGFLLVASCLLVVSSKARSP